MRSALPQLAFAAARYLVRRRDGRTRVLGGVCAVLALATASLAADGSVVDPTSSTVLIAGALTATATSAWCFARGRLCDVECTSVLLLVLAVATAQALSFTSPSLRWATVFGVAGVPLIALMISKLRWAVLVTAACLACQITVVLSVTSTLLDRFVSLAILAGDMPVYVGFTAVLLQRAETQRRRAEHAADHDQLTGLLNRRGLWNAVPALVGSAAAQRRCVGVVAIDLDHFKKVNDDLGHDAGDALLAALGAHLQDSVNNEEVAVRVGGEELAVVGCFRDQGAALLTAEQLRQSIAGLRAEGVPPVTASLGVATGTGEDLAGEPRDVMTRLLTLADRAMYEAKAAGRDRVKVFGEPTSLLPALRGRPPMSAGALDQVGSGTSTG